MSFTEPHTAVQKKRIINFCQFIADGERGRVSEAVACSNHKIIESVIRFKSDLFILAFGGLASAGKNRAKPSSRGVFFLFRRPVLGPGRGGLRGRNIQSHILINPEVYRQGFSRCLLYGCIYKAEISFAYPGLKKFIRDPERYGIIRGRELRDRREPGREDLVIHFVLKYR